MLLLAILVPECNDKFRTHHLDYRTRGDRSNSVYFKQTAKNCRAYNCRYFRLAIVITLVFHVGVISMYISACLTRNSFYRDGKKDPSVRKRKL